MSGAPCQTIVRCLSDVRPGICQCPPDICQTSTTYTPDMYHMPTRHIMYQMYTRCPPDNTRHPPDICQMYGHWYMSGVLDVVLVWQVSGGSWQMSHGASDNHLTGSTRQIATVWRKGWFSVTCGARVTALSTHRDVIGWISLEPWGQWRSHCLIKFALVVFLPFLFIKGANEYVSLSIHWTVDYHSVQQTQTICVTNTNRQLYAGANWPHLLQ